jgi:hypothetical protein
MEPDDSVFFTNAGYWTQNLSPLNSVHTRAPQFTYFNIMPTQEFSAFFFIDEHYKYVKEHCPI